MSARADRTDPPPARPIASVARRDARHPSDLARSLSDAADALRPLSAPDVEVEGLRGTWSLRTPDDRSGTASYHGPGARTASCKILADGRIRVVRFTMPDGAEDDGRAIVRLCVSTLDAVAAALASPAWEPGRTVVGDDGDLLALAAAFPGRDADVHAPTVHGPATIDGHEPAEPYWPHGRDALDLLARIDARMGAHLRIERECQNALERIDVEPARAADVDDALAATRALARLLAREPRP